MVRHINSFIPKIENNKNRDIHNGLFRFYYAINEKCWYAPETTSKPIIEIVVAKDGLILFFSDCAEIWEWIEQSTTDPYRFVRGVCGADNIIRLREQLKA